MAINLNDLTSPIAENTTPNFNNLGQNTVGYSTPEFMIFRIISVLMWVFSIAAIILFIYGGFAYATAGGDSEKAEKGKRIIIGTIIGILIFSFSYMIYRTTIKVIGGTQSEQLKTEDASQGYGSENDEDTSSGTSQGNSTGNLPTTQGQGED